MKLYVDNVEVGYYNVFLGDWEVNLKQYILPEDDRYIFQVAYYNRDWSEFFAIYAVDDGEGNIEYYFIDLRETVDTTKGEYHATKLPEDTDMGDIDKLTLKLILD